MMDYKVAIVGGRDFNDFDLLSAEVDTILDVMKLNNPEINIIIISGNARGADQMGEKYAKLRGYDLEVMKADWNKHGKRAGMMRNHEMSKEANFVVAFWDNVSRGTKDMIERSVKRGLHVKVVSYG